MKWIKASERLPELIKGYVAIKWVTNSWIGGKDCISFTGSSFNEDKDGVYFYSYGDETEYIKDCKEVYWLDESSQSLVDLLKPLDLELDKLKLENAVLKTKKQQDWVTLEEKFKAEYFKRLLNNNPMLYWEIVQWFKDNV